jgi:hypothetical protein
MNSTDYDAIVRTLVAEGDPTWLAACRAVEVDPIALITDGLRRIDTAANPSDTMSTDDMRQMIHVTMLLVLTAALITAQEDDPHIMTTMIDNALTAAKELQHITTALAVAKHLVPDPRPRT